ncbi:anaerobic ribonucleoside-triphosphate reductase activating protein [Mesotoga infera]|uniref:anaerobic ribonucleoside-triphosphate reductase activating protein n=1 Tax=Mesotoga infera TaxID=1236046 RepID=UPI001469A775|nr:anaerobic ribonucleoside-triphosphate reductase activating protein [Mesotoga infera]
MNFAGWERVSLVDYPGKVALTVFTSSCNFNCAYCQNKTLKRQVIEELSEETVIDYLDRRRALIDAIVITGGEPTLRVGELIPFIGHLRERIPGKLVKLDTNGWNPALLARLMECIDFVAMDLKSLDYSLFSDVSIETIRKSLDLVKAFREHEIRITLYPPYIKREDFGELAELCRGASRIAVQQYRRIDGNDQEPYKSGILEEFSGVLSRISGAQIVLRE